MQSISIRVDHGKINVVVDGAMFRDVYSFSLDYVRGAPLLFSCVSDIRPKTEPREETFLS